MSQPMFAYSNPTDSASSTNLLSGRTPQNRQSASSSLADKFSLTPNPAEWGSSALTMNVPEPDDILHNPDPKRDCKVDKGGSVLTARGISNLGFLLFLALGIMMLLYVLLVGYPLYSHFTEKKPAMLGAFNVGGTNATGQIPSFPNSPGLIDIATPRDAYTKASWQNPGDEWDLVFSDEFETPGRTFYPGDDPYWEAVDLHYWQTGDLEWYDPKQATTRDGYLALTMDKADPVNNHNYSWVSGMIQSWNQFCFTGGLLEVAVQLPGSNNQNGFWPAVWTSGNLGRAGFGATTDGLWPYNYDSCDVGTLPNQTHPGTKTPLAAFENGDPDHDGQLSMLPGQRLSACTCPGENHPGPIHSDGSYVGRSAPEIDVFEALVTTAGGEISQSVQMAPFDAEYAWFNTSENLQTPIATLNTYHGGVYQQTISAASLTNQSCYELSGGCFAIYGFEYKPGFDKGYVSWINNNQVVMTVKSEGFAANSLTEIGPRAIPQEPMYIIMNFAISLGFSHFIDFDALPFPSSMLVDYVRVYQPKGAHNVGCDPPEFPTAAYIEAYKPAYTNPNFTNWDKDYFGVTQYGQTWPKNRLLDGCN
ncbi:beta-glucan synthesis-associated [Amylostereum chailletii]|nr:beta-glucan synthesis-associated [Amylostereum chailletii]